MGVTSDAYLALPMDKQVDVWALQVGKSNAADGYQTLARDKAQGQTVGGTAVTSGMLKACFQFGPGICYNDVEFMIANAGQCPTRDNGGVNINNLHGAARRDANLDGNWQSICSWGGAIQAKINQFAATCGN